MSDTPQQPQNTQLTQDKDWDKHNKRAEKAAQVFQEHIASEDRRPKRKQKGGKKWLVVVAIIVGLAVVAGVVYWFFLRDTEKSETASQQSTEQSAESQTSALSSGKTETYDSSRFFLSFQHPDTWNVDETDPDALTVTSPQVALQSASGQEVQGRVVMTIRPKNSELKEFSAGDATAAKQSELITYTKPTQAQRASTYLTFAALSGLTEGLSALYITGDYGYQPGQAILKTEMASIDPIISVTFGQCTGTGCTSTEPVALSLEQWNDPNFSGPIKTMLQSIAIN